MARVGEEFPLLCPACGGDIRLISFITEPGPIHATAAVRTHRISLKRPPRDAEDYLDELEQDGLPQILELLRQCSERI
jgi:hypothetical protein